MELEVGRLNLQKQKSEKIVQELQFIIKEEKRKRKKERKRKVRYTVSEGKEHSLASALPHPPSSSLILLSSCPSPSSLPPSSPVQI